MSLAPPSSGRPHVIRRQYLLDTGFQLRYMLRLAALGGGGVLLVGLLAYRVHRAALADAPPELQATSGGTLLWLAVLGALGVAGLLALLGLVLTHRVAGPVHVMEVYLATLAAGRYPHMRGLRQKDELRGFFDRFRQAVDRIREREEEEVRLLSEVIEVLEPVATTEDTRAAMRILGSLLARKRQACEGPPAGALKSVA